jgi:hypothetical protein
LVRKDIAEIAAYNVMEQLYGLQCSKHTTEICGNAVNSTLTSNHAELQSLCGVEISTSDGPRPRQKCTNHRWCAAAAAAASNCHLRWIVGKLLSVRLRRGTLVDCMILGYGFFHNWQGHNRVIQTPGGYRRHNIGWLVVPLEAF